jgi:pyrroloquinoline-quinone synthase
MSTQLTQEKSSLVVPSKEAFIAQLEKEVNEHPALSHPFLDRCATEMTVERARLFARHYYQYSKDFYRLMAGLISVIPDEVTREPLLLNLFQGGGSDDLTMTHPALFRVFQRALGLTPEEVDNTVPIAEICAYNAVAWMIVREGHWLEALAATSVAAENPIPRFFTPIVKGLRSLGIFKDPDLIFFDAHIVLDIEHYAKAKAVLVPWATTAENQAHMRRGIQRLLTARVLLWDGMERLMFGGNRHR